MFVFSVKANKPKLIAALCIILAALTVLFVFFSRPNKTAAKNDGVSYKASNEGERLAFLSQFGWKTSDDPKEVSEVIIPMDFDDVYLSYNQIQKNQGLDLEVYKGKRVKKWVYEIRNYPGYSEKNGCICATLLILDGIVIGGDVSSLELDGFSHGFFYPQNQKTALKS